MTTTKAAVAFAAGQPLQIETVDLAGPKSGEVLRKSKPPAFATPTPIRCQGLTQKVCFHPFLAMKGRE